MSERLIELFEKERGWPSVINFSDYGDPQSLRYNFQYLRENLFPLKMAEKIVVFPDFSPTEEGKVPTGAAALIDTNRVPDYLSLVGGADIGCQMRLVRFDIDEAEFRKDVGLLDEVVASLRSRKDSVDLGGGNHFLDFLVFEDGQMGALVHTGSFGDQQVELGKLTKNPEKYWKKYHQVIASASENSQGIIDIVSKFYGKAKEIGSWVHNTVTVDNRTGLAIIRKGAIAVTDLNQRVIVPVSVGDGIIWAKPGANVGENTLWSMPHGGGGERCQEVKPENSRQSFMEIKFLQESLLTLQNSQIWFYQLVWEGCLLPNFLYAITLYKTLKIS